MINILQACSDRKVFAPFLRGATWDVWRVFLAVLFGLPLTPEQLVLYTKYTGRTTAPTTALNEAWLICGRRSGKSFILALTAVFLACFRDWRPLLGPGEVGTVMIIARDRRQGRVIKRFVTGLLRGTPMLRQVPVSAGSTTDMVARLVLDQLSSRLGQPIVVENRPGAGGTTGTAFVAKSDPDGYTILVFSSAHTINPSIHANLSYDAARDFAPVIPLGSSPNVLVISPFSSSI